VLKQGKRKKIKEKKSKCEGSLATVSFGARLHGDAEWGERNSRDKILSVVPADWRGLNFRHALLWYNARFSNACIHAFLIWKMTASASHAHTLVE
jgi:hypothetical protein